MNETKTKKANKRRYNLHYIIRKKGFKVDTRQKSVYVYHEDTEIKDKHILALVNEFGYGKQLTMYNND